MILDKTASPLDDAGTGAADPESDLLDRYWNALRTGEAGEPRSWLDIHAVVDPQLLGALQVLTLSHRSNQKRIQTREQPESLDGPTSDTHEHASPPQSIPDATRLDHGTLCILGLLARGGMGEVYLAWDDTMDCQVALKVTLDPALKERFRREIAIQPRLGGHQRIALARRAGQHEGATSSSWNTCPGWTSSSSSKPTALYPGRKLRRAIRQAAEGLEHAACAAGYPPRHQTQQPDPLRRRSEHQNP